MIEYDNDVLNKINDSVDLVSYIGQEIELKRKGNLYFGSCPLHSDSTPSFAVYPQQNRFYCFSCRRHGGIISYLKDYEGYSFRDAVEKASSLARVDLSKMCRSQTVLYNKQIAKQKTEPEELVHEVLDKNIYGKYLKEDIPEWVAEGIRPREIDLFEIRIDRKSNRIVYPVYDMQGNFINIKGRTRFQDYKTLGIAKYMNYYPVGAIDYFQGANITMPFVKSAGEIIIFEGLKSVMKLFGHGIKNAVASETSTLSPEQRHWLAKQGLDVVLAFDSDVDYRRNDIAECIDFLKQFTNVFIVKDRGGLLGGAEAKNSPIDCGIDVWNELYKNKTKVR